MDYSMLGSLLGSPFLENCQVEFLYLHSEEGTVVAGGAVEAAGAVLVAVVAAGCNIQTQRIRKCSGGSVMVATTVIAPAAAAMVVVVVAAAVVVVVMVVVVQKH